MRLLFTLLCLAPFLPLQSAAQAPAGAKPPATINVIAFPGASVNLPAWVAERQGFSPGMVLPSS